jgi:hypothetical protein
MRPYPSYLIGLLDSPGIAAEVGVPQLFVKERAFEPELPLSAQGRVAYHVPIEDQGVFSR